MAQPKSRWNQYDNKLSDTEKALTILLEEYLKDNPNLSQLTIFYDVNSKEWRVIPSTFANNQK